VGIFGTRGYISLGFFLITFCLGIDLIDGYIARKTGTVNEIGKELDSLSDSLTFGIAPSILTYLAFRTGHIFDSILIIGCIIFALGAILRLARFNLSLSTGYTGLPTPLSALLLVIYNSDFLEISYYFIPFGMMLIGWMNITTFIKFGEKTRLTYIIIIIIAPLSPIFGIIGISNPLPIHSLIISLFFICIFFGFIIWIFIGSSLKVLAKKKGNK
jgi:CDP-diacylglycerol--serine O-phosphatidyltransferase